jgi:hypothetical protein
VSCVDNARELESSLVDTEREDWRCVWEQRPGMCWEQYGWNSLAGALGFCGAACQSWDMPGSQLAVADTRGQQGTSVCLVCNHQRRHSWRIACPNRYVMSYNNQVSSLRCRKRS